MGETKNEAFRLNFDRRIKLEFHGTKVISDAGLLAYRELDEALGLTTATGSNIRDIRTGKNTQHSTTALLQQSIRAGQEHEKSDFQQDRQQEHSG
jgi:hypothetical protein